MSPAFRSRVLATSLLAALTLSTGAATAVAQSSAQARDFQNLPWSHGVQHLTESHATFETPADARILTGANAARADDMINGSTGASTEGFVDFKGPDTLYMTYDDVGYVTNDDFTKVDPDAMLAQMQKDAENSNADRKKNGVAQIYVDRWIEKPTLSVSTNTVRFITALHDDTDHKLINATALKLGRHGYERFILVSDPREAGEAPKKLDALTNDFRYDAGSRFGDYVSGDKLAGYGIAALVGTAAGVGIAKTIGFGAILLIIKKFFFVILLAFGGLLTRFKNLFKGRRTPPPPAMPPSSPFVTSEPPPPPSLR